MLILASMCCFAKDELMERINQFLKEWLFERFGHNNFELVAVTRDASMRNYFRVYAGKQSWIVMDASSDRYANMANFYKLAQKLKRAQFNVPECIAWDLDEGFLLLTDLGGTHLYDLFDAGCQSRPFYDKAMMHLLPLDRIESRAMPYYAFQKLKDEMQMMIDWFLPLIGASPSYDLINSFEYLKEQLAQKAYSQPFIFTHRDFHSKNIMLTPRGKIGLLDFQDAVKGPLTYDLASFLKDCYVDLPESWEKAYLNQAFQYYKPHLNECSFARFHKWYDWIGLQRHLKCLGIFAKQYLQNQRPAYLKYIPKVVRSIHKVIEKYDAFEYFAPSWQTEIIKLWLEFDLSKHQD